MYNTHTLFWKGTFVHTLRYFIDAHIQYDTIEEFNVDSKAKYSALSSTRSQKKETKTNKRQCPFNTVQAKIREGSPEGTRVTWSI